MPEWATRFWCLSWWKEESFHLPLMCILVVLYWIDFQRKGHPFTAGSLLKLSWSLKGFPRTALVDIFSCSEQTNCRNRNSSLTSWTNSSLTQCTQNTKKGQMLLAKAQSEHENNSLFMKSSVLSSYATSQRLTKKCMSVYSYFWPWAEMKCI